MSKVVLPVGVDLTGVLTEHAKPTIPPHISFGEVLKEFGMVLSGPPIDDGQIHRVDMRGDRPGSKSGWYVCFSDNIPAMSFGSWKTGETRTWCEMSVDTMTDTERARHQRMMQVARDQREADRARQHEEAAFRASRMLEQCKPADPTHPYLARKGIKPYGLLQLHDLLVVPARNAAGKLTTVQKIDGQGTKMFLPGGKIQGSWCWIGDPAHAVQVVVCEGFATGASIHKATGLPVAVSFNAGNLLSVASAIRKMRPIDQIIVAADNDQWTPGNPGVTKAYQVAEEIPGCIVVCPVFDDLGPDDRPTDFNDLEARHGVAAVAKAFETAQQARTGPENEGDDWPELDLSEQANDGPSDFPDDALPDCLQAAAREAARFIKVDAASPSTIGLSVLATAIGKRAMVEERPGHRHFPALFFVIVAGSGERKSPVIKAICRPLEQWTIGQAKEYERQAAKTKAENSVIEAMLARLKREATRVKSDAGFDAVAIEIASLEARRKPIPSSPRMFTTDATEQKLFQLMHLHGGEFAVITGEGRPIFDSILGRYSGGGHTGDGLYLSGISGDAITRDRVGGENKPSESLVIHDPCLNVCAAVQPDKFHEVLTHSALCESGLLARILPVQPQSLVGARIEDVNDPGLNEHAMSDFYNAVQRILETPYRTDPVTGASQPHLVRLSHETAEARRQWHNVVEVEMAPGRELSEFRDLASKAVSSCVKLALIIHIANEPSLLRAEESTINLITWKQAQMLMEFFLESAITFRRRAAKQAANNKIKKFADWLRKNGRNFVTPRDVVRLSPSPRPENTLVAEKILESMAERGLVRQNQNSARTGTWEVNPVLLG